MSRILFDIMLVIFLLLAPFWVTFLCLLAGFFLFPRYWEGVLSAILIELLYRGEEFETLFFILPLGSLALFLLIAAEISRHYIRGKERMI